MTAFNGLYAITPVSSPNLTVAVSQAIAGGAKLIQYRDKSANHPMRKRQALELKQLCDQQNIPLLINDDVNLAAEIGASGVHLGQQDCDLNAAREQLGTDAIIGISCYNQLQLALTAAAAGADYVAFGRFFPSHSKPDAKQAHIDLLQLAREQLSIPIVAIGGITPENALPVIAAGADMLAVIDGLFGQPDIQNAANTYSKLFK